MLYKFRGLDVDATVSSKLAPHARDLTGGELSHAGVVGVVHEVVWKRLSKLSLKLKRKESLTNGVNSSTRASVASGGAAGRG